MVTYTLHTVEHRVAGQLTEVSDANPLPVSVSGGSSTATIADGADVAEGATTDAIVAAGAAGTLSAKLRRVTQGLEDLKSLIVLAAGENHVGEVGGNGANVAVEFTRPADTTAYTAGDVVSDSTSATTVQAVANFARVNAGTGYVVGARLTTDKKSITPRFRVHLYNASNPTVSADNAAMQRRYADESKYLGWFDLSAMATSTDTTNSTQSVSQDMTLRIPFSCAAATRSIYFVLETLDAFTPASGQKFTLRLWADDN